MYHRNGGYVMKGRTCLFLLVLAAAVLLTEARGDASQVGFGRGSGFQATVITTIFEPASSMHFSFGYHTGGYHHYGYRYRHGYRRHYQGYGYRRPHHGYGHRHYYHRYPYGYRHREYRYRHKYGYKPTPHPYRHQRWRYYYRYY